jgi:hypothetical protein
VTQQKLAPDAIERNRPDFGHLLRVWLEGELKRSGLPGVELQRRSGVAWTTIDRILKGKLRRMPDQSTLDKLAACFPTPAPQLYTALDFGAAQKERVALDWVHEAQAALDAAAGLLRAQATEPPGGTEPGDLILEASRAERKKARRPAGPRKRKAG